MAFSAPQAGAAALAYQDEYAALLSRMAEKGIKSPADGDFLGPVKHWQDLWDRVSVTATWLEMMDHAVLITKNTTEYDGSTGKTYALLTYSEGVAWLAFPGVSTDANMASGTHSDFITWPGGNNTDQNKTVHRYFYKEWKLLKSSVSVWLTENGREFDKLVVTGHSKGGVLAQYFLADYADELSDKTIHFTAFGSPNGGSGDFIKTWASYANLDRIKCYTTKGTYESGITSGDMISATLNPLGNSGGSTTVHDVITWEEAHAISLDMIGYTYDAGAIYYPRGISRKVDTYLTDYDAKIQRQEIDAGSFGASSQTEFAWKIHDDSYYLAAMQGAYHAKQLDQILPYPVEEQYIRYSGNQQKCMDVSRGNTDNGTNIQIYSCNNSPAQQWLQAGSGIYLGKDYSKCLDLDHSNTDNGTNIHLWDCNDTPAQRWIYDVARQSIRSGIAFDKCLDLTHSSTADGGNIQIFNCNESPAQQWVIDGIPSALPSGTDQNIKLFLDNDRCIDVEDGRTAEGTNVQVYSCSYPAKSQYFVFDSLRIKLQGAQKMCLGPDIVNKIAEDTYNVILTTCTDDNAQQWIYDGFGQTFRWAVNTNWCLDVTHSVTDDGNNIQLFKCNGTNAQKFEIY